MEPQDQELINRAQSGDKEAFEILHKKYRGRILNYLYRFLHNYQRAEDLTQETFMQVYTHLDLYRPIGSVSSWIYKIATNIAKNALRHVSKENAAQLDAPLFEGDKIELIGIVDSKAASPEDVASKEEFENEVQKAIDSLPFMYKSVLILCEFQGLSYEEAARILNCSISVIGVHLNRARAQMRKKINWRKFT